MLKNHFAIFEEKRLNPILLRDWAGSEEAGRPLNSDATVLEKLSTSKILLDNPEVASRIRVLD